MAEHEAVMGVATSEVVKVATVSLPGPVSAAAIAR